MPTSAMTPEDKQPEVDMLDASNSNALPEKELVALPVAGYSSGEGFPYAPEDWPLPGDKCGWRGGNRRAASGMTPEDKQPEVDMLDASNSNTLPEKELVAVPVAGYSSGEGLPYAPEDWPLPGDKCGWRVGNRRAASGHWHDRYFFLPSRYLNSTGKRIVFQSKLSLEEYIRKEFPATNVTDFFSSFIWKVPCSGQTQREAEKTISSFTSRRRKDANKHSGSESTTGDDGDCKVGNKMCNLNMNARSNSLAAKACDICCTEDGFCGNCSCILCSQSIDWAYGGYSYIKCEAALGKKHICGHVAHIGCALRTNLAGTIEGNISLDLEYYCRRCDNRTDLISHVCKLIKTCESLDSKDDILKILNVGLDLLHGSEKSQKTRAESLRNQIEVLMDELKGGNDLGDSWKVEDNTPASNAGKRKEDTSDLANNVEPSQDSDGRSQMPVKIRVEIAQLLKKLKAQVSE